MTKISKCEIDQLISEFLKKKINKSVNLFDSIYVKSKVYQIPFILYPVVFSTLVENDKASNSHPSIRFTQFG